MNARKVLVTGGAGFIGANLVPKLLARGCHVLTVDSLTYAGKLDSLAGVLKYPHHEFLEADITDEVAMKAAVSRFSPDWMFHLAAETHVDRSIDDPMGFLRTNILGTGSLLQAALAHWDSLEEKPKADFRFVHISTDEVFGTLDEDSESGFSETSPYLPRSPYSASKAGSDHLVRAWGVTYGLPVIVTNCSNNYGPFQNPEKLIPMVIANSLCSKKIPVYGQGFQLRDWIHVEDHCEALILSAEKGMAGETYLIGGGNERRNIDLVEKLCEILEAMTPESPTGDIKRLIEFVSDRPGHDFRYSVDTNKIRSDLGWSPKWSFEDGLRDTVRWYLENQSWWKPSMKSGTEI